MGFFGGLIGGILGWTVLGPIGGILGSILGNYISRATSSNNYVEGEANNYSNTKQRTTQGDFTIVLLILLAHVIKADGRVTKNELAEVKLFLRKNNDDEKALEYLQLLKSILEKDFDIRAVCLQIKANLNYSGRLELVHLLFKVAIADELVQSEINAIRNIAVYIGLNEQDYYSIYAAYTSYNTKASNTTGLNEQQALDILGLTSDASDDDIKKAYRKMAMKYHPDKLSGLGDAVKESATEKFKAVKDAYDYLKDKRGIK